MRRRAVLGLLAAVAVGVMGAAPATVPANIAAAVADASRPKEDTDRDAARKPTEMLMFAGVKPGQRVVDLMPGGGYFSRLFGTAVGPKGRVYAYQPEEFRKFSKTPWPASGRAADAKRPNVIFIAGPINGFSVPEKVDVIWTSQNYHDMHDDFMGPADLAKVNKAIFDALKPGGVFVVLDHAAADGSGLRDTNTLHRIDPASVKAEVTAAGFTFEAESDVLRNPADPRDKLVFDPSIRGHTDQFIYKFRKPK
jgi:predicted methyltransferase